MIAINTAQMRAEAHLAFEYERHAVERKVVRPRRSLTGADRLEPSLRADNERRRGMGAAVALLVLI